MFRLGYRFSKAGVMALVLVAVSEAPQNLFTQVDWARSARIMETMDTLNARMGRNTTQTAAAGVWRP